jgi:hypothetical protein
LKLDSGGMNRGEPEKLPEGLFWWVSASERLSTQFDRHPRRAHF